MLQQFPTTFDLPKRLLAKPMPFFQEIDALEKELSKIRTEEIDRWQSDRLTKTSTGTIRKEMMRLKHLLNCTVRWRYIKDSPTKGLKTVKKPPGRVRYLTPEERNTLLIQVRPELSLVIEAAL